MSNVFGALNRFIARLDSDPQTQTQQPKTSSSNAYGFQILRNTGDSLPLEPWFDFIIGINGRTLDSGDSSLFATEVKNCAGSTISLGVYGAKGQNVREIYATIPPDGSGLSVSLQWAPLAATDDVWHILDVMPNSPADVAGLLPYGDYVIGSPDGSLRGDGGLGDLVEAFLNQPLRLYVYNHEYDVTRMITITPARNWGGEGSLGCVLGYGALHRIPAPLTEPTQAPGETLFESSQDSQQMGFGEQYSTDASFVPSQQHFLVPANMSLASHSPPPPPPGQQTPSSGLPPTSKAKKQRAFHAPMDDYFAEGEQKSRELEGRSTPKSATSVPPPPRAGGPGPPKAAAAATEAASEAA